MRGARTSRRSPRQPDGHSDTGLQASTSYSYRVRAKDSAGNLSAYSTPASATTPAAQPLRHRPTSWPARSAHPRSTSPGRPRRAAQESRLSGGSGARTRLHELRPDRNAAEPATAIAAFSPPLLYVPGAGHRRGRKREWLFEHATATTFSPPSSSTPTLVQHTASSSTSRTAARERLQVHAAQPGSCRELPDPRCHVWREPVFAHDGVTPSPTRPETSGPARRRDTTDGGTAFSQIFVHPNASAGVHTITVTLNGS